jgi:opacity protein-like surface antigen
MKKMMITVGLMIGVGFTQLNAQNLSFGIKGDANLSNFILTDVPGGESEMKVGVNLGGFMKYDITGNFAIQPELLFNFKTSNTKAAGITNNFEYWGMEIPVYAVGQWSVGNGRFYAGLGPYLGVGLSAKYTKGDIDLYDTDAMQRWDFGGGALIGYDLGNGIQINAGYKIGFINAIHKDIPGDAKMLPQTISLGVGFSF